MKNSMITLVALLCVQSMLVASSSDDSKSKSASRKRKPVLARRKSTLEHMPNQVAEWMGAMGNINQQGCNFVITAMKNGAHRAQSYHNFVDKKGKIEPGNLQSGSILSNLLTKVPTFQGASKRVKFPTYQSAQGINVFYDGPLLDSNGREVTDENGDVVFGLIRRLTKAHSIETKEKKRFELVLPRQKGLVQLVAIKTLHEGKVKAVLPGALEAYKRKQKAAKKPVQIKQKKTSSSRQK